MMGELIECRAFISWIIILYQLGYVRGFEDDCADLEVFASDEVSSPLYSPIDFWFL